MAKPRFPKKPLHTEAGKTFLASLTSWLQDTRLMSEAVYRLQADYNTSGKVDFNAKSWPKSSKGTDHLPSSFEIPPIPLGVRMNDLLKNMWKSQFIFLESLWEEYLQNLILELKDIDIKIFEAYCEKEFMSNIIKDVLSNKIDSIEQIKEESATRFAAGITREPWEAQWKQLCRLKVGLTPKDEKYDWYSSLDQYFEMRNCIIHRQGQVSPILNQKTDYYRNNGTKEITVFPSHLDYYKGQFMDCLFFIEEKITGYSKGKAETTS